MDFEVDTDDSKIVFLESGFDDVDKFGTELFDVERVFDTDNDIAISGGYKCGILEPSGKITSGNFLLNFSKGVFPDVVHLDLLY